MEQFWLTCSRNQNNCDWLHELRTPHCNTPQLQTSFFKPKDSFTYPIASQRVTKVWRNVFLVVHTISLSFCSLFAWPKNNWKDMKTVTCMSKINLFQYSRVWVSYEKQSVINTNTTISTIIISRICRSFYAWHKQWCLGQS